MIKLILKALILFCITNIHAQNMVNNPSFENTISNCTNIYGEVFSVDLIGWDSANTDADSCTSPDLFSICNFYNGAPGPTNMPNSFLGYQYSKTGTRHIGIITYETFGGNYREYIQGSISSPLITGQEYCVSMYVSRANNVNFATNNIGIHFSNTHYQRNACSGTSVSNSLINLTPQLNYTCAPIIDTMNWVRLQWNYIAIGGEQYFIIGNFYDDENTSIETMTVTTPINSYAYYYIDDVSIIANSCCYADIIKVPVLYSTSPAYTLSATAGLGATCTQTFSGVWSGPGITDSTIGVFDPSVAGVGVHTITLTLDCSYTTTASITIDLNTEIKQILSENSYIFPNPTNEMITINAEFNLQKIEVVNLTGKLLLMENATGRLHCLHLQNFAEGIYFLKISFSNGMSVTKKIIKQ